MKAELARRESNKDRVLAYLQQHGWAWNHELVNVGGIRSMGRVHELRQEGWPVVVEHVKGGLWKVTLQQARPVSQAEQASLW